MNDRLIQELIERAAKQDGDRVRTLIAMVAEHCATICQIDPEYAPITIRTAFCPQPKLTPTAVAAKSH